MSKIGVLGEAATATIGTTTAYIVPVGRAAKVKLMYAGIAGANSTLAVAINGITVFQTGALSAGNTSHSTSAKMNNNQLATAIDGSTDDKAVAPGPREYYLSAGDTITYTIGTTNFSSLNFQVVGTEVEVS